MLSKELQDFFLVGGTALSLHIGHRISVDIDMFTLVEFDNDEIILWLTKQFTIASITRSRSSLSFDVICDTEKNEVIEVDLIKYSYPLIKPVMETDGIRLLSIEDIIAMKLSAIAGRGAKKDFYDIFFLLKKYSLKVMIEYFEFKFPHTNTFQVLKSLTYFNDADLEPDPITIEKVEWNTVKKTILDSTSFYISNFR
jgi:predicted nucleotidyltransferase component of viral defense system